MADSRTRPATAGATSAFSTDPALLPQLQADAERACRALVCLIELLHGCPPDHVITTAGLLALLEPVAGGLESLAGDLSTAIAHPHHFN